MRAQLFISSLIGRLLSESERERCATFRFALALVLLPFSPGLDLVLELVLVLAGAVMCIRCDVCSAGGAAAEAVRQGGGHVEHRRHQLHPPVRLPSLLRRERRRALQADHREQGAHLACLGSLALSPTVLRASCVTRTCNLSGRAREMMHEWHEGRARARETWML